MPRYNKTTYPLKVIGDNLYEILGEYPFDYVKDVTTVKEWLGCDIVFKNKPSHTYIFCKKIDDAIIVEDLPTTIEPPIIQTPTDI